MADRLNPFTPAPRVFISYARSDGADLATSLRERLIDEEITLWLDRAQMVGGVGWWRQITEALDQVEILLMVMTPAAALSEIAAKEWRYARQQGVRVCPVFAPQVPPDFEAMPRWMRKAHCYDLDREWDSLVAYLKSAGKDARVPFMAPDPPDHCVARPALVDELLGQLLDESGENPRFETTALHGPGGFGKTTLACVVCHQERVISAFDDGILWVRLGETPNIQSELTKAYAALTGERPPFVDIDDASIQLAERLDQKNCLLVVDDVWDPNHLSPFLRGGNTCARLVTTRQLGVVTELGTTRTVVDRMTQEQAVELLSAGLDVKPSERVALGRQAERLGEWPLLLKLAGSQLRERLTRGDSLEGAIRYLGRALDKKGIVAFDRATPAARSDAIANAVGASLERFSPEHQVHCTELAVFRKDALIPLAAAATLWDLDEFDTEDLVQQLDSAALIDFDLKTGSLRLHNVLRDYFETQLDDPEALHRRLVERWLTTIEALPDTYGWTWIGWHLYCAGASDRLRELLLDFDWLRARLDQVPIQSVLQDYDLLPDDDDLRMLRDALRLASHGLSFDAGQLRIQLVGRLDRGRSKTLDSLLERAEASASGARLGLATASLTHPGGALTGIFKSYGGAVIALAISPDGRFAVSGSVDWTLRLWDLQARTFLRSFEGHQGSVNAVTFSADGRSIFSGAEDRTLRRWDIETGEQQALYRGHNFGVTGVAIRNDGKMAATVSEDGSVRLWQLADRSSRVLYKGPHHSLAGVVFAGEKLAFGAGDWTIRLIDLDSGEEKTLEGHTGIVRSLAIVPDRAELVSGADDGSVRLWSLPDGNLLGELTGHDGPVEAVAVSADGAYIVSGARDKTLHIWDRETQAPLKILEGHAGYIKAVGTTTKGLVISASTDCTIRLWDLQAEPERRTAGPHDDAVTLLAISADGRRAISGSNGETISVWAVPEAQRNAEPDAGRRDHRDVPRIVTTLEGHQRRITELRLTADGTRAITAARDNTLRTWDLDTLEPDHVLKSSTRPITGLDVSADGLTAVTISRDRVLRAWNIASGRMTRALVSAENKTAIASLADALIIDLDEEPAIDVIDKGLAPGAFIAMSPDGRRVAIAGSGNIRLWNLDDGSLIEATGTNFGAETLTFDATSEKVVLGSLLGPVIVWDMQSEPRRFDGHQGRVLDTVLLSSRKQLISAGRDNTIRSWDLDSSRQTACLRGPSRKPDAVSIAPDGQFAYSVYGDTLVAFDLAASRQLCSLSFDHQITTLTVTPSGHRVAVGDQAGQVHFVALAETG